MKCNFKNIDFLESIAKIYFPHLTTKYGIFSIIELLNRRGIETISIYDVTHNKKVF